MTPRAADGSTLQRRVWQTMRRLGPATAQQIADELGHDREGVRKAISYLIARKRAKKRLRREGGQTVLYTATGTRPPQDLRGKSPGSRNQAKNLGRVWNLMMKAKHGADWKPKPVQDSHPLAQALKLTL